MKIITEITIEVEDGRKIKAFISNGKLELEGKEGRSFEVTETRKLDRSIKVVLTYKDKRQTKWIKVKSKDFLLLEPMLNAVKKQKQLACFDTIEEFYEERRNSGLNFGKVFEIDYKYYAYIYQTEAS